MKGTMEETQGGNEGGSTGQWMKKKEGMKGARGAMDETPGENEGGSRGPWMKHKGGMKGARRGNG